MNLLLTSQMPSQLRWELAVTAWCLSMAQTCYCGEQNICWRNYTLSQREQEELDACPIRVIKGCWQALSKSDPWLCACTHLMNSFKQNCILCKALCDRGRG